jgi:hypothetical protein
MTVAARRSRQPKLLAAGAFEGEISSFRLQLAAEGKTPKTIRMYTEAVRWFAPPRWRSARHPHHLHRRRGRRRPGRRRPGGDGTLRHSRRPRGCRGRPV